MVPLQSFDMPHLDSPVTSDIVKGDRLGNAEAHKEDVRLQVFCMKAITALKECQDLLVILEMSI